MKILTLLSSVLFAARVVVGQTVVPPATQNFTNPIIWQDLADTDLLRINDTYYYSSSTMHFSPGAPILRSYDLVNWEYLSHSVPSLDFNYAKFDLNGGNAYNWGVYASTLQYRKSKGLFYWIGCIQQLGRTYVYTASNIEGPWTQASVISNYCYYDAGLLIDESDDGEPEKMYVSYGKWVSDGSTAQIWVAQLTADGLQNANVTAIFHSNSTVGYVEGTRFFKFNGTYYILVTNPGVGNGELILKSGGGALGPYSSSHQILKNNGSPVPGASDPYQGAFIETEAGAWWYIAFVNRFPAARIPVMAPITWDSNGWPNVEFAAGNAWGKTYPYPLPQKAVKPMTGTDNFNGTALGPQYEWNHNPDNTKWSVNNGLTLQTATLTTTGDFFMSRNTLSHRILGPSSNATIQLDYSGMADGDKAGLVTFRYDAAWIAVVKSGSTTTLQMMDGMLMSSTNGWQTSNFGSVIASKTVSGGTIYLRTVCQVDSSPGYSTFYYSTDGTNFSVLGQRHSMADGAIFFVGTRYGVFNFATKALGGKVVVKSFTLSQ